MIVKTFMCLAWAGCLIGMCHGARKRFSRQEEKIPLDGCNTEDCNQARLEANEHRGEAKFMAVNNHGVLFDSYEPAAYKKEIVDNRIRYDIWVKVNPMANVHLIIFLNETGVSKLFFADVVPSDWAPIPHAKWGTMPPTLSHGQVHCQPK